MTSIYLSSSNPRWSPKSEGDLKTAISEGLLEETHYLDLKEKTDPGKAGNKELARDLASFAVDAGTLIIGVREDKTARTFHLEPQPLKGLPEKIEQVARSLADPPLNVISQEIESSANDGTGYLIVHVPASAAAPHMVDGRYYGRGDKTKYQMSDAEVLRHHVQRRATETDALTLLQQEIDQDPLGDVGEQSHFFFLAQPTAGRRDMLLDLTSGQNWQHRLTMLVREAYTPELSSILSEFSPNLAEATQGDRRAGGAALSSHNLADGRQHRPTGQWGDENVIEVQFLEDGGLRLYSSRLSDTRGQSSEGEHMLFDAAAVGLTRRMLEVVRLTAENAGYFGNWNLAVGATRLQGRRPYAGEQAFGSRSSRYSKDTYEQATGATWADLNATPGAITSQLLGPLLRSLGSQDVFTRALSD